MLCDSTLHINQVTTNDFLIAHCSIAQSQWHYVVDVLDKDYVGISFIQVLNQCTMSSRAEEEVPVTITIGSIVEIYSNGVGRLFLFAHGHVVFHSPHLLHHRNLGLEYFFKLLAMLGRHGEVNVNLALAICGILCAFFKVLLERGVNVASSCFVEL